MFCIPAMPGCGTTALSILQQIGNTIPVFAASATKDIGMTEFMDSVVEIFPNALEYVPLAGGPSSVKDDAEPFGIVFRSINGKYQAAQCECSSTHDSGEFKNAFKNS